MTDRFPFTGITKLIVFSLLLVAGCDGNPSKPADTADKPSPVTDVLARVDGSVITTADLERAIVSIPRPAQLEYINPPQRQELLESLIDRKLMAERALAERLDRDPVVSRSLETAANDSYERERLLAQAYLDTQLGSLHLTEAEIGTYYDDHTDDFTEAERVRVTRAVMTDEKAARSAREWLLEGADAVELKSRADGRGRVSSLWLQRSKEPNPMEHATFNLQPGEVSEVFPVRTGFAVLRADERVAAKLRPLAEVRESIFAHLNQESRSRHQAELLTKLRKNAVVSIDQAALAAYQWQD